MTDTITIALSPAAQGLLDHCRNTGNFVADSRASMLFDVPLRVLTLTMQPAVDSGLLKRVRDPSGVMGYRAAVDECLQDQRNGTATAQTQANQYQGSQEQTEAPKTPLNDPPPSKPKSTRGAAGQFTPLPELDLSSVQITLAPRFDGRSHGKRSRWYDLFDKLAESDPVGDQLPTATVPAEYGNALSTASAGWNKARKDGKRISVSRTVNGVVLQLEQREVA
jgi:hypothetical protein